MNIESKVRQLVEKKVNEKGVIIDNIEYIKEGNNNYLRITIDSSNPNEIINIDRCVEITNIINPILDENENLIKESYILDISTKERGNNNE